MSKTMLELQNITQVFGGLVAVNDVSIHVDEKEIIGLIGPNGAGKTTTFNCITGVYNPTKGHVLFEGKDITGKPIHEITKDGMARTFQNIRLFKSLSVLDNVRIGMHIRSKSNLFFDAFHLPMRTKAEKEMIEESMKLLAMTGLAGNADVVLVAPATANVIGKIAGGIADDLLTAVVMAAANQAKIIIAPAMNTNMYENPIVQANIEKLKGLGYQFIEPKNSHLACGTTGKGALADVDEIIRITEGAETK